MKKTNDTSMECIAEQLRAWARVLEGESDLALVGMKAGLLDVAADIGRDIDQVPETKQLPDAEAQYILNAPNLVQHRSRQVISDTEDNRRWILCWVRPPFPEELIYCRFCDQIVPPAEAHRFQDGYVGSCCWDVRLRTTE